MGKWLKAGVVDEFWIREANKRIAECKSNLKQMEALKTIGWAANMGESIDYMIKENLEKLADAEAVLEWELCKQAI